MLWLPFKKKQYISKLPVKVSLITETRPELKNLLNNDETLRIWLPEHLRSSMDVVVKQLGKTLSQYLREYFVIYLYGNHALLDMYKSDTGIFYSPKKELPKHDALKQSESTESDFRPPLFSRAKTIEFIPGLGKNIVPLKILLNTQIKADLQILADKSNMALSQFVREILVSHFLGHSFWPERQQMLNIEHVQTANEWESGQIHSQRMTDTGVQDPSIEGVVETI